MRCAGKAVSRDVRLVRALVSDFFYPGVGGVEGHMLAIGRELVARGHTVIVITHAYAPDRTGIRHLSVSSPTTSEPQVRTLKIYHLPLLPVPGTQATLPQFFASHPLIRTILLRERVQLLHAHQALSSLAHEALLHARCLPLHAGGQQVRAVFTDHSLFDLQGDAASVLTNRLLRFALGEADRVVCVSYTGKENTSLRARLEGEKVAVIPNAVDAGHFYPDVTTTRSRERGSRITIVILSRLTHRKGVSLLTRLIPSICRRHPDVDFLIGGDGPGRVVLEQMREKMNTVALTTEDTALPHQLERVRLVGNVLGPTAVREHLQSGQLFLSASLTEAFGTTLVEAAACGLLCVATPVGGVPEVLPQPGRMILAERAEWRSLRDALEVGLERVRAQQRGEEKEMVEDEEDDEASLRSTYTWPRVVNRLERVYLEALAQPPVTTLDRLKRVWEKDADARGGSFGALVFCIVLATDVVFSCFLEWFWPGEEIEKVWSDEGSGEQESENEGSEEGQAEVESEDDYGDS
ncbi:UDP-Glycosyltransferase/glycogen phosphorylase [Jaminaea rosea]|uniref:UDP-Glycosyltransferase/glycogen phosphorylase n=1 Tax=Jaminaea rosea TaxID=1569628 RepID=A0A316UKN6_9BASI|nr:UDP-Glycosyltransferase/glycogen phosphorylase [Jaminaea rosea]PWN25862.1 UDP-Glycosyltransferase/glycogen phosphorylase [Jaminaea rosea]